MHLPVLGIEKLLKIISEVDNIKCQDVALSILGNCCLDDKVRLRVSIPFVIFCVLS